MSTKKDSNIYCTLTQIQRMYRRPLAKIKETLIKKKICKLDGSKAVPYQKYIDSKEVLEIESQYEENVKYYKYQKTLIQKIFTEKNEPLLNPITWKEAQKNLLLYSERVSEITKKYYCMHNGISGFEDEAPHYVYDLLSQINHFTKEEQEIIFVNIKKINNSPRAPYSIDIEDALAPS